MHLNNFTTRREDGLTIGTLAGDLPNPCWEVAVAEGHWDGYQYHLRLEATLTDGLCAQVITPFRHDIHLGRLRAGQYCLVVNGREDWTFWFGVE